MQGLGDVQGSTPQAVGRETANPWTNGGAVLGWIRLLLEWWRKHWLRIQMAATPIGSLLVTLWLSQAEGVGWWWNSQAELEVAVKFASGGILFYTASFAALETGVWLLMVLALYAIENYEARKRKRERERQERQRQLDLENQAIGAAMWREAERQSKESGESPEEIFKRLQSANWRPD